MFGQKDTTNNKVITHHRVPLAHFVMQKNIVGIANLKRNTSISLVLFYNKFIFLLLKLYFSHNLHFHGTAQQVLQLPDVHLYIWAAACCN